MPVPSLLVQAGRRASHPEPGAWLQRVVELQAEAGYIPLRCVIAVAYLEDLRVLGSSTLVMKRAFAQCLLSLSGKC